MLNNASQKGDANLCTGGESWTGLRKYGRSGLLASQLSRSAGFVCLIKERTPPKRCPFPEDRLHSTGCRDLVHFLFERLRRLENRSVAGGEGHSLTGCRVSAGSLIAVLAGEGAESEEGDGLACGEGIHDGME